MTQKTINLGKNFWDASVVMSTAAATYHDVNTITSPYDNNPIDLTIFVSCYNESAFIVDTLDVIIGAMKIVNKTYEILIIDDGSKDNSVTLVQQYIADHPEINLIHRVNQKNKGLAQNYIDGAFIGRGKYYRLICGDNAEPLDTIVQVINMMGEADIIVPYYISAEGKSSQRQFLSKAFTSLVNLISGNKINYYNGLQVHLRFNIMRWHPSTRGFGFQAGLLCTLLDLGFTYKQVPCITIERRGGRGNAVTWKNLRSVMHILLGVLFQRLAPWS
jgi:glycosyltransferase involved in cell wall biosynthesis